MEKEVTRMLRILAHRVVVSDEGGPGCAKAPTPATACQRVHILERSPLSWGAAAGDQPQGHPSSERWL